MPAPSVEDLRYINSEITLQLDLQDIHCYLDLSCVQDEQNEHVICVSGTVEPLDKSKHFLTIDPGSEMGTIDLLRARDVGLGPLAFIIWTMTERIKEALA
jgi:hypothetical protein